MTLLSQVQGLLERTFRIEPGLGDAARFVIGDEGYRRHYAAERHVLVPSPGGAATARTLVRDTDHGVRISVYYPDRLIACLEQHPPQRGIGDANVDAFADFIEELDHLLCIAERTASSRPVTLFELELHANVSKYFVLARFLGQPGQGLDEERRCWLRHHLFWKRRFTDPEPGVRRRYREARHKAVGFIDRIGTITDSNRRLEALRRFHQISVEEKLRLIDGLAVA